MKTAIIFLLGLLIDLYCIYQLNLINTYSLWFMPIPISAVLFYLLLTTTLVIFYAHPAMNFISPSTMILRLLEEKKMTHKELLGQFSEDELINNRLSDLEKNGLIKFERGIFKGTDKGKKLIFYRTYFRKIFRMRRED